jgi:glutaredoxin
MRVMNNNQEILMQRIVLYTMNNCPHCQMAKKFLEQQQLNFRLCNVQTAAGQKEFRRMGLRSVPVFKIEDRVIQGVNLKQLKKLIG